MPLPLHPRVHVLSIDGLLARDGTLVSLDLNIRTVGDLFRRLVIAALLGAGRLPEDFARERRLSWARLLRRILEVDPLLCPRCGVEMRVVAVITEPAVVDRILENLKVTGGHDPFAARARADAPRLPESALKEARRLVRMLLRAASQCCSQLALSAPAPASERVAQPMPGWGRRHHEL